MENVTGTDANGRTTPLLRDVTGSIPLRVAPMLMLGLSVLMLVVLYVTTT